VRAVHCVLFVQACFALWKQINSCESDATCALELETKMRLGYTMELRRVKEERFEAGIIVFVCGSSFVYICQYSTSSTSEMQMILDSTLLELGVWSVGFGWISSSWEGMKDEPRVGLK